MLYSRENTREKERDNCEYYGTKWILESRENTREKERDNC
jgi:hypothetical protein